MTETYRSNGEQQHPAPASLGQTLLWMVLVVSAVGNSVSSLAGVPMPVHLGFGLVTAACVAALIARRLRRRS